ncbi:ribosomal protein L28e [Roridomyces roridus]|uniref:Ribosomal protein L28e n=1 Tax=Roridomyces roridus TaxID=1738132 RepID=A0AAD7BN90_9AGAR|nr:ribosomal protein L28e [Roridomyces roridus]
MSTDLQWLLLRGNNSFIVKRDASVGRTFSRESGNLRNLHSQKFSGLACSKTIAISDSGNGIQIVSKKLKASPTAVARGSNTTVIRPRSGGRRALGITAAVVCKKAGRPDLRTAALARVSALLAAQKEPKSHPAKKSRRSTKAAAAAAAASSGASKSKSGKGKAPAADEDDVMPDLV